MSQPLLSILIPTVLDRDEAYKKLFTAIYRQCKELKEYDKSKNYGSMSVIPDVFGHTYFGGIVSVISKCDNKEITIGEKRELLYKRADGLFSWQIDDDDDISDNAIELILNAIKSNPSVDVITFEEYINKDGVEYTSNHSATYSKWDGDWHKKMPDGFNFHRTPFFKNVIRTELARSVSIPSIRYGEDNAFADLLLPLIKSEIHISEQLYRYIHVSSNHNERYGIKQ